MYLFHLKPRNQLLDLLNAKISEYIELSQCKLGYDWTELRNLEDQINVILKELISLKFKFYEMTFRGADSIVGVGYDVLEAGLEEKLGETFMSKEDAVCSQRYEFASRLRDEENTLIIKWKLLFRKKYGAFLSSKVDLKEIYYIKTFNQVDAIIHRLVEPCMHEINYDE